MPSVKGVELVVERLRARHLGLPSDSDTLGFEPADFASATKIEGWSEKRG